MTALNREVKRKGIEMSSEITTTYEKFMSVYRFKARDPLEFSTSMHYYNRDLEPIQENTHYNAEAVSMGRRLKTPYEANTKEYKGNIVSKQFKQNMINNLGVDTICTI